MNIVGVAKTDIFSTCVFNNIVGVVSFFNSLFSLRSPLRTQLKSSLSYTYICWNFSGSAPNYLLFLRYRGVHRPFAAVAPFRRWIFSSKLVSRRTSRMLARFFNKWHKDLLSPERQWARHWVAGPRGWGRGCGPFAVSSTT